MNPYLDAFFALLLFSPLVILDVCWESRKRKKKLDSKECGCGHDHQPNPKECKDLRPAGSPKEPLDSVK